TLNDFASAAPEIVLLTLLCGVLVADLFVRDENRSITFWLSIATLVVTALVLLATPPETSTLLFDGSYISDSLSQVLKFTAVVLVGVGFVYARDYLQQNRLLKGEFYVLG